MIFIPMRMPQRVCIYCVATKDGDGTAGFIANSGTGPNDGTSGAEFNDGNSGTSTTIETSSSMTGDDGIITAGVP